MSRFLLIFPSLLLLIPVTTCATAIVAVRSPDALVIAADSLMTVKDGTGALRTMQECKIRRSGGIFFAMAGLYMDPARGFDVRELVESALAQGGGVDEAAGRVAKATKEGLKAELLRIRREAPVLYDTYLMGRGDPLVRLLLAAVEEGIPKLIFLGFRQLTEAGKDPEITVERRSCPNDCRANGVSLFYLGEHRAMDAYLKREKVNWKEPETAARLLIEEEISAGTPGVGGEVDLLRIDRNGANWITRKGECGGPEPTASEPDADGEDADEE